MEDDDIKNLFAGFNPELASGNLFMAELQRKMEAVEIVRQHQVAMKKRNRLAIMVASLCGFAMGVLLSILSALCSDWIPVFSISLPYVRMEAFTVDYQFMKWVVMAIVSGVTAMNAYEIAIARLNPQH